MQQDNNARNVGTLKLKIQNFLSVVGTQILGFIEEPHAKCSMKLIIHPISQFQSRIIEKSHDKSGEENQSIYNSSLGHHGFQLSPVMNLFNN